MQDMLRAVLPGVSEDVKASIEAKIAAANKEISPCPNLFRHSFLHVLQPLNVLPPDATRRKRSLSKLLPVMLNLHVKKSHVLCLRNHAWKQSLLSTQSAPSCLQSLSSSFHHVLSDVQSSPGVDENIVA